MSTRIVTVTLNPAIDKSLQAKQFAVGAHIAATRIGSHPAGKGINVSRVLAALGTRSIATGFVGRDELHLFEEYLERVGQGRVVMQLLVVRGRTRENITVMDPIMDTETHIRDEGFSVQIEDVRRITSKVGMLAREDSIISIGGSLPPGVKLGDLRSMVHVCQEQGARIIIDTSTTALEALRGEPLWMAKLNDEELATLSEMPTRTQEEAIAAARSISASHGGVVDVVIATRGAAGAILIAPNHEVIARVFVHPGRIANTVGSGDAMLAGVLHQYVRTGDWLLSMKLGVATATANAISRVPGAISDEDIREFLEAASIEEIDS